MHLSIVPSADQNCLKPSEVGAEDPAFGAQYVEYVTPILECAGIPVRKVSLLAVARFVICENLTRLRKGTAGISQPALAKKLGIAQRSAGDLLKRLTSLGILERTSGAKDYRFGPVKQRYSLQYGFGPAWKSLVLQNLASNLVDHDEETICRDVQWCWAAGVARQATIGALATRYQRTPDTIAEIVNGYYSLRGKSNRKSPSQARRREHMRWASSGSASPPRPGPLSRDTQSEDSRFALAAYNLNAGRKK